MNDDFNTSKALAVLFQFIKELNAILSVRGLSEGDKEKAREALKGIDSVLGVMDLEIPQGDEKIEALISERERARKDKNWSEADRIRRQLEEMGIAVTDTRHGTVWR
jgi:cysteinyl-tRNA synthetase